MKKLLILSALLASCTTTKVTSPVPTPIPGLPFDWTTDQKSGDIVLTPKGMQDQLLLRWNTTGQAGLMVYKPWGVCQAKDGQMKCGQFKKPEEKK